MGVAIGERGSFSALSVTDYFGNWKCLEYIHFNGFIVPWPKSYCKSSGLNCVDDLLVTNRLVFAFLTTCQFQDSRNVSGNSLISGHNLCHYASINQQQESIFFNYVFVTLLQCHF